MLLLLLHNQIPFHGPMRFAYCLSPIAYCRVVNGPLEQILVDLGVPGNAAVGGRSPASHPTQPPILSPTHSLIQLHLQLQQHLWLQSL